MFGNDVHIKWTKVYIELMLMFFLNSWMYFMYIKIVNLHLLHFFCVS